MDSALASLIAGRVQAHITRVVPRDAKGALGLAVVLVERRFVFPRLAGNGKRPRLVQS